MGFCDLRALASPFGQSFREAQLCFTTHFYNPEAQISFVEHNDLVLICAIIKHMSETQKQNQNKEGVFIWHAVFF